MYLFKQQIKDACTHYSREKLLLFDCVIGFVVPSWPKIFKSQSIFLFWGSQKLSGIKILKTTFHQVYENFQNLYILIRTVSGKKWSNFSLIIYHKHGEDYFSQLASEQVMLKSNMLSKFISDSWFTIDFTVFIFHGSISSDPSIHGVGSTQDNFSIGDLG